MEINSRALQNPPYLYFLCAAAPLVAITVFPSFLVIVGSLLVATVGWIAFAISARLTSNLYVHALLGAVLCAAPLYLLEIWRAAHLRQTFKWDGVFVYINGRLTAAGVWQVLLDVGKYGVAFALLTVAWNLCARALKNKSDTGVAP